MNHPLQTVLELACAAQRTNKDYVKFTQPVYSDDGKLMSYQWDNKLLMLTTLDPTKFTPSEDHLKPVLLCTNKDDQDFANEIQKFYRRLMFKAIEGDNEFLTEVNALLNSAEVPENKFGFIACLPSVFKRDYGRYLLEKRIKQADAEYLALIGEHILDKDCEVLSCVRSKNFDAFNIDAIIDNKIVSWMSQRELNLGPTVIVKAKVKDHSKHWKYENPVTRLNYVKAVQ